MHGFIVGEVAPLAPLVVPLGEIAALLFILGCLWVLRAFVSALLNSLASVTSVIPFFGGVSSKIIHGAESHVSLALGQAESFFDARLGSAFHMLARVVDWTYRELARHANLLDLLAALLVGQKTVDALHYGIGLLHRRIDAAAAAALHLIHRLEAIEQRVQHGITANVLPRLGRLERDFTRTVEQDIASLRARDKTLAREYDHLWKYVRSHPWTVVTEAFVGAVAIALTRLGLNWIRCPSAKSFFNKRGCNAWSDLEALLLVGEVVGLVSLVELAREEQKVVGGVATAVRDVLEV